MTHAEYAALTGVNFSTLKEMARCPAKYRAALAAPKEATDAMDLGSVFHLATTEPEKLGARVAVWEEGQRRGKAWEAFCASNAGKLIVRREDFEHAKAMAEAVRNSPQAAPYLKGGEAEKVIQWEEGGRALKGRVDYLSPLAIVDLKSTRDASLEAFGRQMFNSHVHAQLAMYRSGVAAKVGALMPCVLIAVENNGEPIVQVYRLTEAQLEDGANLYRAWLATLAECERTKTWPGYWPTETELKFPRWSAEPEVYLE